MIRAWASLRRSLDICSLFVLAFVYFTLRRVVALFLVADFSLLGVLGGRRSLVFLAISVGFAILDLRFRWFSGDSDAERRNFCWIYCNLGLWNREAWVKGFRVDVPFWFSWMRDMGVVLELLRFLFGWFQLEVGGKVLALGRKMR